MYVSEPMLDTIRGGKNMEVYMIQYLGTMFVDCEGCGRYTSRVLRELRGEYGIEA